ncbi:MAG: hypothetical protein WC775_00290 [Patescibacteria group bacterium]|jgi:hypothetical protein
MKLSIIRYTALVVLLNFLTVTVLVVGQSTLTKQKNTNALASPTVSQSPLTPTDVLKSAISSMGSTTPVTTTATNSTETVPAEPVQQEVQPQQIEQQPIAEIPVAADVPAPVADTPAPQPVVDNRCIVTVRGQQFDITQFRFDHSGGNIFSCGADMTDIFNGEHGDGIFQQMQRYRI